MGEGKNSRRARASAVATAVAITAPILFLGGALARAAEAPGGGPTSSSVVYTDANGDPTGGAPTTTTTTGAATGTFSGTEVGVSVNGAGGNTGSSGGGTTQTMEVSILPGQLSVTPTSEVVSFTKAHGQGSGGRMAGSLSTVTVVDARGSLVGWRATVSLQSVDGVSAADLAKAKLCVNPGSPTVVAGNPPEVKAGQSTCGKAGDALRVFFAPPNGGGGTFSDTASLTLSLPGVVVTSPVSATLAVAVS